MGDLTSAGRWILVAGVALVVIGGALWALGRAGIPLGRLPGDIRIQSGGFTCVVPIATSILLSVLLTLAINILARLLNR